MNTRQKTILLIAIVIILMLSLFCGCSATKHTINFDSNGGSECPSMDIKGKHGITLPTPQRDGYTFEGWYFDKDTWQERLTGTTYSNKRLKEDVTVYAKWNFTGYIITFEENGGSQVENMILDKDEAITSQPFTEREGYTFLGWCVDSTLAVFYELGTPINKSMTLYAKWVANENKQHFTITFVLNGGQEIPPYQILEGEAISLNEFYPTRPGYDFEGWFLDADFDLVYPAGSLVTTNITLYAKWSKNPDMMQVTFDTDGGSSVEPVWVLKGDKITQTIVTQKEGYTFVNWYIDELRTQIFDLNNVVMTDLHLYAKWQEVLPQIEYYTVKYYSNGELIYQNQLEENSPVENRHLQDIDEYIFAGWYIDSQCTIPYDFNDLITQNINLYAKWVLDENYEDDVFSYSLNSNQNSFTITQYNGTQTDIVIAESFDGKPITRIGDNVFKDKPITSITFSNNLMDIGISAFENCNSLTEIVVPSNIQYIGRSAFNGCENLETINLQANPAMEQYIFANCRNLRDITLSGTITSIGDYMFADCINLKQITLPNGCLEIGTSAFENCTMLSDVNINDNLKTIRNKAFSKCTSLSKIGLKNVENIKERAFSRTGITNLVLTDSITNLGKFSFSECAKLQSVYIGAGLSEIGTGSFGDNVLLTSFEVSSSNTVYKNIDNNLYSKDGSVLLFYAPGQENQEFVIPDDVEIIETYAFTLVESLTKIVISEDVRDIKDNAFYALAFLSQFEVVAENQYLCDVNGVLYNKEKTKLIKYPIGKQDTVFVMENTVEEMSPFACSNALLVKEVTLSSNLKKIPEYAFYNSINLTDIEINNAEFDEIGEYAFYNCSSLQEFELSNETEYIGSFAFSNTGLENFVLTSNITTIGDRVFENCFSLQRVRIGIGAGLQRIENNLFNGCSSLFEIVLLGAPQFIGNAFSNCNAITELTINGDAETIIAEDAFESQPVLHAFEDKVEYYTQNYAEMFSEIKALQQ